MPTTMPLQRRGAINTTSVQRELLKRYVDLAFARGDQIMVSTKLGTAVTCSVADWFTLFLATPITKGVEGVTMASVRAVRRTQAQQLYAAIDILSAQDLQVLSKAAALQGEPSASWLGNQIFAATNAAAAASIKAHGVTVTYVSSAESDSGISGSASVTSSGAASAAASASAASAAVSSAASSALGTVASAAKDAFVDYISDAALDQAAAFIPGGLGAAKAGMQVMQVTTRISTLQARIELLKKMAG